MAAATATVSLISMVIFKTGAGGSIGVGGGMSRSETRGVIYHEEVSGLRTYQGLHIKQWNVLIIAGVVWME